MSTTQPPPNNTPVLEAKKDDILHYTAVAALVISPILIALPPRKFDIYTISLLGCVTLSTNHLLIEYTGQSIPGRLKRRLAKMAAEDLPSERAREVQARLKAEKLARAEGRTLGAFESKAEKLGGSLGASGRAAVAVGATTAALREKQEEEERKAKERGVLEKIWMGQEKENWKAERDQKEKEALEEGKGYGDLIMEQIWEVWNWGQVKTEDLKKKDEEVVKAKENGQNK